MAKKPKKDTAIIGKITVVATQAQIRYACFGAFGFGKEAQEVEVTADQLREIRRDPVLTIVGDQPELPPEDDADA
jgi:hypothetical protein